MSTPINSKKRPFEPSDLSDQPPAKKIKLEKIKTEKGEGHPLDSSRVADLAPGISANIENAKKHTTARFQRLILAVQMGQPSAELRHLLTHIVERMSNSSILNLPISSQSKINDMSMRAEVARNYYKFAITEQIANLEEGRTHNLNELFDQFLGSIDTDSLLSLPSFSPSASPIPEPGSDTDDEVIFSEVPFENFEPEEADFEEMEPMLLVPDTIAIEEAPAPVLAPAPASADIPVINEALGIRGDNWSHFPRETKVAYDRSQEYIRGQLPGIDLNDPRKFTPALNKRLGELEGEAVAKGNLSRHGKTFINYMNQKQLWEETDAYELEAPPSPDLRVAAQTTAVFSSTYTSSSSSTSSSSVAPTPPALEPITPPSPVVLSTEEELEQAYLAADTLISTRGKKQAGLKAMMDIALKGDLRACRRLAELYRERKLSPQNLAKKWTALAESDFSVENLLSLQQAYEKSGFEFADEVNAITKLCAEKNHAPSQSACAEIFKHKGEFKTAIYWYKKAFDQLFVSGERHDILARSILGMLECYLSLENLDEAYELVDKVRAARTMQSGPIIKRWIDKVIELYTERGEMEEARAFLIENFTAHELSESYDENGHILQVVSAAKLVELFEKDNLALKAFSNMLPFRNRMLSGSIIDRAPQMRLLAGLLNALIYFEGINGIARDKLKARESLRHAINLFRSSGSTSPSCSAEAAGFLTLIDLSLGEHLINDDNVKEEAQKAVRLAIKHGSLIAAHTLSDPDHARTITLWGLDAQKSSVAAAPAGFSLSKALISHLMRHFGEKSFKRDTVETLGLDPIDFVDPGSGSSSSSHTSPPTSHSAASSTGTPLPSVAPASMTTKVKLETYFKRSGFNTEDPEHFANATDRSLTDPKLREYAAVYHALITISNPVFASLKPHARNSDYLRLARLRHNLIKVKFDPKALEEKELFAKAKLTPAHSSLITLLDEYEALMDKNGFWREATSTSHLSPPPGMTPPTTLRAAAALSSAARGVAPAAGMISPASFPAAAPAHARRAPGVNSAENIREQLIVLFDCKREALMDESLFNELWENERKKLAPTYLPSITEKVQNYRLKMGWGTRSAPSYLNASSHTATPITSLMAPVPSIRPADLTRLSELRSNFYGKFKEVEMMTNKDAFLRAKSTVKDAVELHIFNEYETLMNKYKLWIEATRTTTGPAAPTIPMTTSTTEPDHIRLASLRKTLLETLKVDPRAIHEKDVFLRAKAAASRPEELNVFNEYEKLMDKNKFWKGSVINSVGPAVRSIVRGAPPSGLPASTAAPTTYTIHRSTAEGAMLKMIRERLSFTSASLPMSPGAVIDGITGWDTLKAMREILSEKGVPAEALNNKTAFEAFFKSIPDTAVNKDLREQLVYYSNTLKRFGWSSADASTASSTVNTTAPAPALSSTSTGRPATSSPPLPGARPIATPAAPPARPSEMTGGDLLKTMREQLSKAGVPADALTDQSSFNTFFYSIPATEENKKLRRQLVLYSGTMVQFKKWVGATSTATTRTAPPPVFMTDGSPEEKRHSFQHLLRAGATDVKSVQKILSYVFDCDEDKLIDRSFFDEKMAQALKEGNAHLTAAQLTRFRGLFSSHMERLGYWK